MLALRKNRIGIVGGTGPYAGLDLLQKVFDNTLASCDQDHVDTLLFSLPSGIVDRTEYLEGREEQNPAVAIYRVLSDLEEAGATVAGIPCNTAHAAPIFEAILEKLKAEGNKIRLLNMINETASHMKAKCSGLQKIGVLCTTGTYRSRVYQDALEADGFVTLMPPMDMQEQVIHPAIYDTEYGIKARSNPVDPRALKGLEEGLTYLTEEGADALILGCTEIPIAFRELGKIEMPAIDPSQILARALISHAFPDKLKPFNIRSHE